MVAKLRRNIGRELNEKWGVNAKHALYRANGTWYHHLTQFPGALFDAKGYVLFETEDEYIKCPQLQLGKQANCPHGIASIPSYVQITDIYSHTDRASDLSGPKETERVLCVTKRVVRDTPLARHVKNLYDNECQLCGLKLMFSGSQSYAEAHHIKPLGPVHHGPDVAENIICVCPNCHAQLDYGAIKLNKAILLSVPKHHIADEYIDYHNSKIYRGPDS